MLYHPSILANTTAALFPASTSESQVALSTVRAVPLLRSDAGAEFVNGEDP